MKLVLWITAVSVVMMTAPKVYSLDLSPDGPAARAAAAKSLSMPAPDTDKAYKRNRLMQVMGYSLLGVSAVLTITGAAMVQGSPWGPVARSGFITFGVGLTHFISAAFLLGFSHTVIRQELPPTRPVQIIKKSARYDCREGDVLF